VRDWIRHGPGLRWQEKKNLIKPGSPVTHWNEAGAARKETRRFPEPMVSGERRVFGVRTLRKANKE
jgi:hypothetical protein